MYYMLPSKTASFEGETLGEKTFIYSAKRKEVEASLKEALELLALVEDAKKQKQGVREALIKLGWTPPEEGAEKMTSERLTQLIKMIHKDLKMRSDEEGRTPISHFIWVMIKAEVDYDLEE
jgi:hypothetical protein